MQNRIVMDSKLLAVASKGTDEILLLQKALAHRGCIAVGEGRQDATLGSADLPASSPPVLNHVDDYISDTRHRCTLLQLLLQSKQINCAMHLIKAYGADVSIRDAHGATALHTAVRCVAEVLSQQQQRQNQLPSPTESLLLTTTMASLQGLVRLIATELVKKSSVMYGLVGLEALLPSSELESHHQHDFNSNSRCCSYSLIDALDESGQSALHVAVQRDCSAIALLLVNEFGARADFDFAAPIAVERIAISPPPQNDNAFDESPPPPPPAAAAVCSEVPPRWRCTVCGAVFEGEGILKAVETARAADRVLAMRPSFLPPLHIVVHRWWPSPDDGKHGARRIVEALIVKARAPIDAQLRLEVWSQRSGGEEGGGTAKVRKAIISSMTPLHASIVPLVDASAGALPTLLVSQFGARTDVVDEKPRGADGESGGGNTPLHCVVSFVDFPELVRMLVERGGAPVSARNGDGDTALDIALRNKYFRSAEILKAEMCCLYSNSFIR